MGIVGDGMVDLVELNSVRGDSADIDRICQKETLKRTTKTKYQNEVHQRKSLQRSSHDASSRGSKHQLPSSCLRRYPVFVEI